MYMASEQREIEREIGVEAARDIFEAMGYSAPRGLLEEMGENGYDVSYAEGADSVNVKLIANGYGSGFKSLLQKAIPGMPVHETWERDLRKDSWTKIKEEHLEGKDNER